MTVTETVKGENQYEFQEYNNHARSPMTISKLVPNENKENWPAAVRPSEPLATIPKDETTLPENDPQMDCSL
jgi:branched-chain amino acid transport system substrate-binding protein